MCILWVRRRSSKWPEHDNTTTMDNNMQHSYASAQAASCRKHAHDAILKFDAIFKDGVGQQRQGSFLRCRICGQVTARPRPRDLDRADRSI
jgi:hypothetical protein